MKKLVCFILICLMVLPLASCFRSEKKFDYDMSDYITIPDYDGHKITIEGDAIQASIDGYLMTYATEYQVQRGDRICIEYTVYKVDMLKDDETGIVIDKQGEEIVKETDCWVTIGDGAISKRAETSLIGAKIGSLVENSYTFKGGEKDKDNRLTDFFMEEYNGTNMKIVAKIKTIPCKLGDIANVSYTGYFINDDGTIAKDNEGKDKVFDESSSSSFYIGSHMAVDEFEENIKGMLVGEKKDFYVTFPEDYHEESVKGKRVMFKVELKSISVPPIYDNAFVKKYFPTYDTTKDFEESLKEQFTLNSALEYISQGCVVKSYPKAEYNASANELKDVEDAFYKQYQITLDSYIKSLYNMTRDEYIKSNMKTEMIYYAIQQLENIEPTSAQLTNEKQSLIDYYKTEYMANSGLTEAAALQKAEEYVNKLGETYVYENVMFFLVDERVLEKVVYEVIPKTYTSITETIAKAEGAVTE